MVENTGGEQPQTHIVEKAAPGGTEAQKAGDAAAAQVTEQSGATGYTAPGQAQVAPSTVAPAAPIVNQDPVNLPPELESRRISGTHQMGVQTGSPGGLAMPTYPHQEVPTPVQEGNQQATTSPDKARASAQQAASDASPESASTQPNAGKQ